MQVACPSCGHVLTVPPDKAAVPNLKAKCRCGTVFAIGPAPAPARSASSMAAGPARPSPSIAAATRPKPAAAVPPAVLMGAAAGAEALVPPPLPPRPAGTPAGAPARTAAAAPRLAPVGPAAGARPRTVPVPWRRCQNHPQTRSEHYCPQCTKGFCGECVKKVQNAAICPACEGLCIAAAAYEALQEKERQRARPMSDEIGLIAAYPLGDWMAYVMLALFTWFFGLFAGFSGIMVVLSKGVLTWYSFNAVSRVSIGNLRDVMPDFRDASDISHALRLSLAALVISAGPLFACVFGIPGAKLMMSGPRVEARSFQAVHAEPPASTGTTFEAEREGPGPLLAPLAMLAIVLAVVWLVVYLPVALTVAALSKSFLSTLNPLIGIDTIKKMGGVYWQAVAIYLALVAAQVVVGFPLRFIPLLGGLVRSFVDAYVALAIGCTLGLAVFKKAVELGWD